MHCELWMHWTQVSIVASQNAVDPVQAVWFVAEHCSHTPVVVSHAGAELVAQSPSELHWVRQAVPPLLQSKDPQLEVPPALHVPPPQVDGAVCTSAVHDPGAPQGVPAATCSQAPLPLQ